MSVEPLIRSITPTISTFSVPFKRFGLIPIGGRSTAIKLASGELWIAASSPLTQSTKDEIARLGGPVKWLVALDIEHTMSLTTYSAEYPDALCVGPEGLKAKLPSLQNVGELKTNGAAAADEVFGYESEFETAYFKAHPNKDVAWLHKPSGTLIEADLLFTKPTAEQKATGGLLGPLTSKFGPGTGFHQTMVKGFAKADPAGFSVASKLVAGWSFDRLIPCHGEIIETGGKEAWTSTFAAFLN